ncbi:MAG: right-handed parallel beta-helix repeat-containing protein, partial [Bacteroidota bacterium]
TAHDNLKNGIDLINGALCINNTAYRNGEHGIECGLGSFIVNNASNDNGWCMANNSCLPVAQGTDIDQGAGIVGSSNTVIKNNQCLGNYFGILVTGFDMTVIGNQVQDNAHAGIMGLQSGILIIKNTTANNGCEQAPSISNTNPTNGYPLGEITLRPSASNGGAFGPIIDISTGGDLSTVTGATHPFANFID